MFKAKVYAVFERIYIHLLWLILHWINRNSASAADYQYWTNYPTLHRIVLTLRFCSFSPERQRATLRGNHVRGNLQYCSPALETQAWLFVWGLGTQSCFSLFMNGIWLSEPGRKLAHPDISIIARGQELRQKLISRESQKSPIVNDKKRNPKATQKARMAGRAHRRHQTWWTPLITAFNLRRLRQEHHTVKASRDHMTSSKPA